MERKLPGKFFRKFGNSFRGWPLFWKFWKMLFHSLTAVVANSKPTFWLIFWKSFTHSNTHYVFHNWAVTVTGWLWSVKNLQVNLMWSYFDFRYMCLLYRDWRHVSSMTKITTSRKLYSTGTIQRVKDLCWRHCLHFSSLAYDLTQRSRGRIYELNAKVERSD